jgi:hypothetical protein
MSPQATYPIFLSGTSAADPLLRNPNRRHGLLRARRERPRERRAAEQRDELAPFPLMKMHPTPNKQRSGRS